MDLCVCRLRQIAAAIAVRKQGEIRLRGAVVEWQTRTLGMVIAGLAQSEKSFNALMRFIERVELFPVGAERPVPAEMSEEDIEEIMSGRHAERAADAVPTQQVAGLLGHGFDVGP